MKLIFAAAAAALVSGSVAAQEIGYAKDSLAFSAMMDRDWTAAEAQLRESEGELAGDPAHLLNLAQVMRSTGRENAANALYERVLLKDDMLLVLSNGETVSAHELAETRLRTERFASR